ncbi:MAG: DJ-1/PfpI family protein [Clostridia bacterium]|nr:DJ-1/PfpI family protein [Clostridia bacterium]
MFYLFLADGFEEIEALATVDILRRADIPVLTVAVTGQTVSGAHGIQVEADIPLENVEPDKMRGMILPGGIPGTPNLEASDGVMQLLDFAAENGLLIAAICAAPSILGKKGLLSGKKATCYPGFEKYLAGAVLGDKICVDGNIITGQAAGVAADFAFAIIESAGKDAKAVRESMLYV